MHILAGGREPAGAVSGGREWPRRSQNLARKYLAAFRFFFPFCVCLHRALGSFRFLGRIVFERRMRSERKWKEDKDAAAEERRRRKENIRDDDLVSGPLDPPDET